MKAFLLILSVGWCLQGWTQQDYFMFMQSENRQPFYVRVGEKTYSSSATGHVILSRLKDSAYAVTVGFPQNQFPEQDFTVRVSRRDRGFELKNLGEKGWALFDWQTMELINAAKAAGTNSGGYSLIKKSDDFAKLMASVVNDTAVMYTVVMDEKKQPDVVKVETKPEEKKPEPVEQKADTVRAVNNPVVSKDVAIQGNPVTPKDSSAVAKQDPVLPKDTSVVAKEKPVIPKDSGVVAKAGAVVKDSSAVVKTNAVVKDSAVAKVDVPAKKPDEVAAEPRKDSVRQEVTKVAETKKTEQDAMKDSVLNPPALGVIAVVKQFKTDTGYHMLITDDLKDSIDIFIAADVPQAKKEEKAVAEPEKKQVAPLVTQPKQDSVAAPVKTETVVSNEVSADTSRKQPKLYMINSDCRAFATPNDVDKLRVKIISEKDSEGRIAAAKKVFKTKCFSALQIKALSENFPLDEQKYKFLEMAYPFVSDTGNFKNLVSLLQDPVYVQRFRKLVRLD